jgi:integrase
MSVHKRNGKWQVKWQEPGGRQRSRTFDRKGDADRFDAEVRRRKQLGPHLVAELGRSALTLDQFVHNGFHTHAATLAPPTRDKYVWASGYLTELHDEPLIAIDVPALAAHQRLLLDRGATPSTVREVMARLSGILQVAVEHGHLPANRARGLRKVPLEAADEVDPLAPAELERIITGMAGRSRAIALLAGHIGLRPLEIRRAPWDAFDGSTLTVGRARTKRSAARTRVLDVPGVTARELKAWRLESGGRGEDPIIGEMSQNAMRLWARRALPEGVTLYRLRHTHASALHYCGYTLPAAARRMGHGAQLHLRTYAHVIDALGKARYADLDALIAAARAKLAFPGASPAADAGE